jgi:hypothetical protein
MHDGFIKKYMETGYTKIIDKSRTVMGRSKNGFLIPISICVRQFTLDKGGTSFIGIMKPIPGSEKDNYFLLNNTNTILSFSRGCALLFSTSIEDIAEAGIPITSW